MWCLGVQVEAEVLVVKGDDVAETISSVVSACQIHKLVVGVSSQGNFMRYSEIALKLINYELYMEKVLSRWNGLGNPRAIGHPLEYARVFRAFVWCMLFQKVACPWFILLHQTVTAVLKYSRSMRVLAVSFIQMISRQYQVKSLELSIVLPG